MNAADPFCRLFTLNPFVLAGLVLFVLEASLSIVIIGIYCSGVHSIFKSLAFLAI